MEQETVNIHSELISRCKQGQRSAQFDLYKLYCKAMFNTALRLAGNEEDAEDIIQESFISAFQNLNAYRQEASFGSWLKRIVINKALNHVRKEKRNVILLESYEMEEPEEPIEENSIYTVEKIKESLQELPGGFRTVLSLYLFEGYDHKEISSIMGISENTSKSQYKRAKDKLKKIIKEKEVKYG